jgi:hypothetical protein
MKKLLYVLLLLWSAALRGQQPGASGPVFGALLGFDSQTLGIETLDGLEPERTAVLSERPSAGGSVGVFGRWPLLPGLWLQQEALVSVTQHRVLFRPDGPVRYRFVDAELPLHFVLTNRGGGRGFPLRGSFLFGGRLGWNFAPDATDRLRLYRERAALDLGLGVEILAKKWRIQPELVYSHGMNNLHSVTNATYDGLVGRVVRDRLTLRVLVWKG